MLTNRFYVDLGLKSGILWATNNLGALTPWDKGNLYCWGKPHQKDIDRDYINYLVQVLNPRKNKDYMSSIPYSISRPEDDPAQVLLGKDWKLPNEENFKELYRSTSQELVYYEDSLNGLLLISNLNGNKLFLPLSDVFLKDDYYFYTEDFCINYWTSDQICRGESYSAYFDLSSITELCSLKLNVTNWDCLLPIRPIKYKK